MGRISRRAALATAAGAVLAFDPAFVWGLARAGEAPGFTPRATGFLEAFCDTLVPATDTPGASACGVHTFLETYLARESGRDSLPDVEGELSALEAKLDDLAGSHFVDCDAATRGKALQEFDGHALGLLSGGSIPLSLIKPYRRLKLLALTGYYTSEVGACEELRFTLTPGRYDPDIAIEPGERDYFHADSVLSVV